MHEAMPLSRAEAVEYIWLLPMTCPLPAFSEKYGEPSFPLKRAKRLSSAELVLTASMPLSALAFASYISLPKMVCPLLAKSEKKYLSFLDFFSSNFPAMVMFLFLVTRLGDYRTERRPSL